MQVIRDDEMSGVLMIPLFAQHNIKRCNVEGCNAKPSTILQGDNFTAGICEPHYQEAKEKGKWDYKLTFD